MIGTLRSLDRVLKGELSAPLALGGEGFEVPVARFVALLVGLGGMYGACMGSFAVISRWGGPAASMGWMQLGYSAAKVPMLFFLTLLITLPSLYVFSALIGCQLDFRAVIRLLIAALGVCLAVLASFGTILAFFSLCTTSYPFMVLLNVVMFAVAGLLGMNFLLRTLHRLALVRGVPPVPRPEDETTGEDPPGSGALVPAKSLSPARIVKRIFFIWVLVFGLIGAQMGWVLRPFIGAPNAPVSFFRTREGNFLQAVVNKSGEMAAEWEAPASRPAGAEAADRESNSHR